MTDAMRRIGYSSKFRSMGPGSARVQPRLNFRQNPVNSGTIPTSTIAAASGAPDPEITSMTHFPSSCSCSTKRCFAETKVRNPSVQRIRGSADFYAERRHGQDYWR